MPLHTAMLSLEMMTKLKNIGQHIKQTLMRLLKAMLLPEMIAKLKHIEPNIKQALMRLLKVMPPLAIISK